MAPDTRLERTTGLYQLRLMFYGRYMSRSDQSPQCVLGIAMGTMGIYFDLEDHEHFVCAYVGWYDEARIRYYRCDRLIAYKQFRDIVEVGH